MRRRNPFKNARTLVFIALLILATLLSFLIFRDILVFGVFLVLSAIFNYYQNRLELGFDLSPSLVLMIIFSIKLGFGFGLFFLIFGAFLPSVLVGGFGGATIFFLGIAVLIAYLGSIGITDNFTIYAVGLILLQSVLGFVVSSILGDSLALFSVFIGLGMNMVYFIILGNLLTLLL
jgi:hypothetical protein